MQAGELAVSISSQWLGSLSTSARGAIGSNDVQRLRSIMAKAITGRDVDMLLKHYKGVLDGITRAAGEEESEETQP